MKLVEFVPPVPHPLWKLCPQMGITDVIVKVNPDLTGLPDPWRYETLSKIVGRLADAGLKVVGLEGDPFDMAPIKNFGEQGTGSGKREETLGYYRELLESMGRLGIKLLCYNFMVGKGWSRTGVREGRGGAKATYFSLSTPLCDSAPSAGASASDVAGASSALGAAGGGETGFGRGFDTPPRPTGRLMRIVFIGAFSLLTGATPMASESEIRAVLCFAASF